MRKFFKKEISVFLDDDRTGNTAEDLHYLSYINL